MARQATTKYTVVSDLTGKAVDEEDAVRLIVKSQGSRKGRALDLDVKDLDGKSGALIEQAFKGEAGETSGDE